MTERDSPPRLVTNDPHDEGLVARVHPADWANPAPHARYDLVVIGAGTAGLVCAAGAAALGARVALVERDLMGGDCLNFGCVPSKAVLRAGHAWKAATSGGSFGAPIARDGGSFPLAMSRMRALRTGISDNDSAERFRRLGVDVFFGSARFSGRDRVRVDGTELVFRKAVVATGARPAIPPIDGLAETGYLTNETIFALTELPRRLGVIGAGPIGCEMAQAFARFGSRVLLVDRDRRILPRDDPQAAEVVAQSLVRDGVEFVGGATVSKVARRSAGAALSITTAEAVERIVEVDRLLVAVGRAPNVEDLDLERAGIAYERSGIRVDPRLRTSNRRVFACGDVTGGFQFTHAADAAARTVIRNALFLGRARHDRIVVPWCTYTDPEIGHVGMADGEAAKTSAITTITIPHEELDRARLDGAQEGFLRLHVEARSGRIRGATAVGTRAGEIVGQISMAMTAGVGLAKIASAVYPYPSYGEALKRGADAWRRTKLTPASRRILNLLRSLGSRL
jgi:pyruvate/2-oxoglutarate dehydrogenase complex dihydrolipoamide dehydrogenase (E3) component